MPASVDNLGFCEGVPPSSGSSLCRIWIVQPTKFAKYTPHPSRCTVVHHAPCVGSSPADCHTSIVLFINRGESFQTMSPFSTIFPLGLRNEISMSSKRSSLSTRFVNKSKEIENTLIEHLRIFPFITIKGHV